MPGATTRDAAPFLLDADQLKALASPRIVRRGIAYFKEDRVTDLRWDRRRVWATVEGSRPGGYQVEISVDEDRELVPDCDCPFDWEPACKHAVATLLSYAAHQPTGEDQVEGAASAAVAARMERGRSEVEVKHVAGDRWLGTWEARSLDSAAQGRGPWKVELRSVGDRINHCTCPDFAVNRLGTCKHIEAVRHHLRKRAPRKFERYAGGGPPTSIVHLDWGVSEAPQIRLRRAAGGAPGWLDNHFDANGFLLSPLPAGFHRLQRAARRGKGLVITPEVHEHLARLDQEAKRRVRAEALVDRIRSSDGALPGVSGRLYPYQMEGVAFLAAAGRALLADDMGLGKTVQAIAAAAVLREEEGVRRTLVICPASLKHQWAREVRRFTGVDAAVVDGRPAGRLALYRRRAPFTIVNYELALRDAERVQAELAPDLLILDEAQRIKNWRTKTAAAVKSLDTPFAFVLTGTPLENRLEDLYSVMQVVDPRVLGPLWRYLLDFHVTDERGRVLGYRNLAELRRRLAPVLLRRDRSLVRDQLPERVNSRLDVELDRRQRNYHDEGMAAAGALARIAERRPLTPSEEKRLMAALQMARMACNAAGLVDGETVGSPKLTELASLLEELCVDGGRKVVVFSQWERMTRMAASVARGLGLGVVRLHGGVPTRRRGGLIERFREDPAVQVFLSTDAGGVGLNLQAANVVINLDLPWNPAVLEQRIARVHRLGQKDSVQAVLLVARNSYEERIDQLISAKRELFINVVGAEASENVVGVSKKMVEMVLHTLPDADGSPGPTTGEAAPTTDVEGDGEDQAPAAAGLTEPRIEDESLAPVISRIQSILGDRIERIVAAGGGLIVVAGASDAAEEEAVSSCGGETPVAVVDPRSWASLSRLGSSFPPAQGMIAFDAPADTPPPPTPAERKLRAAEALAERGHDSEALNLATESMIHAAAMAAGTAPPPLREAAVWLHTELVPHEVVLPEHVASISRGLALTAAVEVPRPLVEAVLADAGMLVRDLG